MSCFKIYLKNLKFKFDELSDTVVEGAQVVDYKKVLEGDIVDILNVHSAGGQVFV